MSYRKSLCPFIRPAFRKMMEEFKPVRLKQLAEI
jgi:hypothetical protein